MHPLRVLREFLKTDRRTHEFSTQQGLADLLDCSAILIRRIELGHFPVSPKLGIKIEGRLGIRRFWLYGDGPQHPVTTFGEPATIEWVLKHLEGARHRTESSGAPSFTAAAEMLGEWVKRVVSADEKRGMELFHRIAAILDEESRKGAETKKSSKPGPALSAISSKSKATRASKKAITSRKQSTRKPGRSKA